MKYGFSTTIYKDGSCKFGGIIPVPCHIEWHHKRTENADIYFDVFENEGDAKSYRNQLLRESKIY